MIAGKDKIQVQQKRYRYTSKERDDSSGLCYYGARYLAPWLFSSLSYAAGK
jgi:RHS repeat-associated protein